MHTQAGKRILDDILKRLKAIAKSKLDLTYVVILNTEDTEYKFYSIEKEAFLERFDDLFQNPIAPEVRETLKATPSYKLITVVITNNNDDLLGSRIFWDYSLSEVSQYLSTYLGVNTDGN